MPVGTQNNADLLRKNLLVAVELQQKTVKYPVWSELAGVVGGTTQLYERMATVSGAGLPQVRGEFQDPPITNVGEVASQNVYPQKLLLGMNIASIVMDTDQYGIYKGYARMLKKGFDVAMEIAGAVYLNGATDTTLIALPNGEAIASTTHQLSSGGTTSNLFATAQTLSISALESATENIMLQKSDKGYIDGVMGPYQVEVGPLNAHLARQLITPGTKPQTADRQVNTIGGTGEGPNYGMVSKVVVVQQSVNSGWWAIRAIDNDDHARFWLNQTPFKIPLVRYQENDSYFILALQRYVPACFDFRGTWYSLAS